MTPKRQGNKNKPNFSRFELSADKLRYICDPKTFDFKTTAEIPELHDVIGQERAVSAIQFGLEMKSSGYNIFVTGLPGTGKSTIVRDLVGDFASKQRTPSDWCMVNNFKDEYRPKPIELPPGKAGKFARQMNKLIEDLKKELKKAFEAKSFKERESGIHEKFENQKRNIYLHLEELAAKSKIQINRTSSGFQTIPLKDGKPMTPEEFHNLPEPEKKEIEQNIKTIQSEIETSLREINKINQAINKQAEELMQETSRFVVSHKLSLLKEEYHDSRDVSNFLSEVEEDIIENVEDFLPQENAQQNTPGIVIPLPQPSFNRYKVNILVDRKDLKGAPVIFESNPSYTNVFGRIDKRSYMGTITTDFTMIQAGSLLRANGGYLIMEIESVLMNPIVWEAVKRSLQNKLLHIEDLTSEMGYATSSLRPEPIPLDVKVILLGSYEIFQALQNFDLKFNKIFKVRADFDYEVKRTDETVQLYARFISRVCKQENLLPFTPKGVAALIEYGEKQVANKNKISLRFGSLVGILREADYWARKMRSTRVTDKHVIKAFNQYRFRYNLFEEKIHESFADNSILIDVDGAVVGQVNALSVYQIGEFSFGRPSRITAETFMGKVGIINIEREAKLSGKTHDKGVLILSGYLGKTFAQNFPLSVSISITFEQSYSGIDGDSASSTELYAIISSLSGIPIKQGIAVTGSVNQKGEIQAIGGVNQKIEGFFEVCQTKGLTGKQGVIIPEANIKNLMLKKEVIDAVKAGKFHIYSIKRVEEGIEILTGIPAGKADKEGNYPEGTVFGEAQKQLKTYLTRSLSLKKEFAVNKEDEED